MKYEMRMKSPASNSNPQKISNLRICIDFQEIDKNIVTNSFYVAFFKEAFAHLADHNIHSFTESFLN